MTTATNNINDSIADVRLSLHSACSKLYLVVLAAREANDPRAAELAKIEAEIDALRRRLFEAQ